MQKNAKYILGLDLGVASAGWAVLGLDDKQKPYKIIECDVRVFPAGENAKDGKSLNLTRRESRSQRRRTRRNSHRLERLKAVFKKYNLLPIDFNVSNPLPATPMLWANIQTNAIHKQKPQNFADFLPVGIWGWRVLALEEKLNANTWASVLLHIVKHRGYLSQRKNEANTDDKELGKLLKGVADNSKFLQDNKAYRTPAELAIKEFIKKGHIRNKAGDYSHTFNRTDLAAEIQLMFSRQRDLGNMFASEDLEQKVIEILMTQRDALAGNALLNMVGFCTFEENEKRCAKACYSFERFMWLQKLNNLRIGGEGRLRSLTDEEYQKLIDEPYNKAKLTYTQVRKILDLSDRARFKGLNYFVKGKNPQQNAEDMQEVIEKTEKATFIELKAYHAIRKALDASNWDKIKTNTQLLDDIGTAFTIYKTDVDISQALQDKVSDEVLEQLLQKLSFSKFGHLSLKAIKRILEKMQSSEKMTYDQACTQIYGNHYGLHVGNSKNKYLPVIPTENVVNPVVIRTLSEARKVVNSVIRKYGTPARIHIENARELGKSFKDRKDIEREQEQNRAERQRVKDDFKATFGFEPSSKDILTKRLYDLQHSRCLYSDEPIEPYRLFETKYVEIDHALPYSRSFDNSFNNKVLVLAGQNQNKGNLTPYEYFDGKSDATQWQEYKNRVLNSSYSSNKKQNLLRHEIDKEFLQRNLNDTRYITRFLANFIEDNLELNGEGKKRVFAPNGRLTSMLRGMWGFANKDREANNRHHALDAIITACANASIQQRTTTANKQFLLDFEENEKVDLYTGEIEKFYFEQPWEFFHKEAEIRVFSEDPAKDLQEKLPDRPQALHERVKPMFVSHAPRRKVTGQAHQETRRSAKMLDEGCSVVKKPLRQLKLKDIENIVGYRERREKALYAALEARLNAYDDNPEKAFAEPFYKPSKTGKRQEIKSVRIMEVQKSGKLLFANTADKEAYMQAVAEENITATTPQPLSVVDNAVMARVDVFGKANKKGKLEYYLVPIYTWQVAEGILPNKAIIQGKDENEWLVIDETFMFKFSLYANDLVKTVKKDKIIFGYFVSAHRGTGNINIKVHDLDINCGKKGVFEGIGVKTLDSFEKYQVDVLGEYHKVKKEKRQGFR